MYSVMNIADAILKIAKRQGKRLTPLQLMKLVYIAHGWSLGLGRGDLFADRIEAWKYGPVIPDLYRATKHWGRNPISFDKIGDDLVPVDGDTEVFLTDVVEKYGNLSGIALSSLTHQSGTPWDRMYEDGANNEIPDDLIEAHYKKLWNERRQAAPS